MRGSGEMNARTHRTSESVQSDAAPARVPFGADPLTPRAHGLYDPTKEHDSCGVGFVAHLKNRKSHDILEKGLQILVSGGWGSASSQSIWIDSVHGELVTRKIPWTWD